MAKAHASLSPKTNLLLIPLWAAVASGLLIYPEPRPPAILAAVGAVLGVIGGAMQHLSVKQASGGFSAAASLLDVRRTFKASIWGRRYITFLYLSKAILAVVAFTLVRQPIIGVVVGYLAGYFALMFVREVVTLRDTFFLSRLTGTENAKKGKTG